MKIVLVTDAFPPLRTSGAVQLRDLTREFVRQGHDITVLFPDSDIRKPWSLEKLHGVQVLRLRSPRTKEISYLRRTLGEWLMPRAMWRNLKRSPFGMQKWDGVLWYSPSIFHGPLVRELKRQSGCKGYLIIRDIFPEWAVDLGLMGKGPAYQFFKWTARRQYEVADTIGVQSIGNLTFFREWSKLSDRRKLQVLQNWLDFPNTNVNCRIRLEDTPLSGRKIFVYAGNMGIAQNMDSILELATRMRRLNDVGFLLVGRGSEVIRLRDHSQERGLDNVLIHDEIDPDEIPSLFSRCQAGIVSLDPRHKTHNIPGKFLAYMQNGLPVFAIVNPGNDLAHLIKSENVGEVCETKQIEEIEKRFIALIARIDKDSQLVNRCRNLFQSQFTVSSAVEQIVTSLRIQEKSSIGRAEQKKYAFDKKVLNT